MSEDTLISDVMKIINYIRKPRKKKKSGKLKTWLGEQLHK